MFQLKQQEDKENQDDTHVETEREKPLDEEDNIVEITKNKIKQYIIFIKWVKCCWHDLIV